MAKGDAPRNADFVARLVTDPSEPPQTRVLTGWLGDSAEEGYRRLYTEPDVSSWIEVPTDAILHFEELRDVQPSGGVMVWVKADAALKEGGSRPVDNQSAFAEAVGAGGRDPVTRIGPICTTRLRPNCPPTAGGPQCPTPNGPACPPLPTQQGPRCPTPNGPACPTPFCPTRRPNCTVAVCPTERPRCQTDFGPRCPSIAEICTQFGPECPTVPPLDCTVAPACHTGGVQCTGNPCIRIDVDPTPVTLCFICPPRTQHHPNCPIGQEGVGAAGPQGFAAGPFGPTGVRGCTFFPQCRPGTFTPRQCPTLGIACTHFPQCPPRTFTPEECPTLGIACTQFAPQCPPRTFTPEECPTLGIACTQFAPQCPPRTFTPEECPTLGIACTQFAPQCPSAVDACPTRFCGVPERGAGIDPNGNAPGAAPWPTPATRCFVCDPWGQQ